MNNENLMKLIDTDMPPLDLRDENGEPIVLIDRFASAPYIDSKGRKNYVTQREYEAERQRILLMPLP